jgi:DNA-binding NtrC family response regulator
VDNSSPCAEAPKPVVLLIEDEAPVRRPMVITLTRAGFEVIEAGSAAEGAAQWDAHQLRISAVISDNMLGAGPTGLTLLRQFCEAQPMLPTILISGVLTIDVMQRIESASTVRCLQKPFDPRTLVDLLHKRMKDLGSA